MSQNLVVAALYKFVVLEDFAQYQAPLFAECQRQGVMGTILLAKEGINGTIAGTRAGIDGILAYLKSVPQFSDLEHKESHAKEPPFKRLKKRLKKEIVTIGVPSVDPNTVVGEYVDAKDWNALISDDNVILIDTRNDYEVQLGTFKNAVNPKTRSFGEFPEFVTANLDPAKTPKVAMCCTGGIRCEKASSYMLQQGFQKVYHLKGGILKYLEEVPKEESLWQGDCFVFDERVVVNHDHFAKGSEPQS